MNMAKTLTRRFRFATPLRVIIVTTILGLVALAVMPISIGRTLGKLADYGIRYVMAFVLTNRDSGTVRSYSHGEFTNVVFLHRSVGHNLIEQGNVRALFTAAGYAFWDQGYNRHGLRNPSGDYLGYGYFVPRGNTDPDGLARIFSQPVVNWPLNTFSRLLQHEVIVFKSCFPVNNINSDEQLEQYKQWYLQIRDHMDQHPDKLFVVVTPPPLNPAETNIAAAARARLFAAWLVSDEYLAGHTNVVGFDLFDQLAVADSGDPESNMLRPDYRRGRDSHPNRVANESVAPVFVDFIIAAAQDYRDFYASQAPESAASSR
jgi:hypothetical protein